MRAPLSGRGALLGDFGIGMAAALGGKPRRARIDALGRNRWPSAGASLDLDFVNRQAYVQGVGVCTPADVITLSGGAGGTRVNSVGQVVAASGLRYDHNPITMACKGLLIEEQRTNLMLRSSEFESPVWNNATPNLPTVTPNATTAPDGTQSMDMLTAAAGGTVSCARQAQFASGATGNFSGSICLKAGTSPRSRITLQDQTSVYTVLAQADVVWTGGVPTLAAITVGTFDAPADCGNGVYRFAFTANTATASPLMGIAVFPDVTAGVGSVYAWGAQLDAGAVATSYIPTTSAAVTRTADNAIVTGANFSSWFNAAQGTFVAEIDTIFSGGAPASVGVAGLGPSQRFLYISFTSTPIASYDGAVILQNAIPVTDKSPHKAALSYDGSIRTLTSDGTPPVSASQAAGFTTGNTLYIGAHASGGPYLEGHIKRLRYWPRQLSNAELQALTA
jgi:hypothetical protein